MTLTIELPPEIEAGLLAKAQARGLDVSLYVQNMVLGHVLTQTAPATSGPAYELPPEEWIKELRARSHSHDSADLPILSDEAMSRETIYEDRGL